MPRWQPSGRFVLDCRGFAELSTPFGGHPQFRPHASSSEITSPPPDRFMELLISIRNEEEARLVGRYSIDHIDIKEPMFGSLGAASPAVWRSVVQALHRQVGVSLALGELVDEPDVAEVPPQAGAAKVGLAGCSGLSDWPIRLGLLYARLPESVSRVAVYYADRLEAGSPKFSEVLQVAKSLRCETVLIDTYGKVGGSVFHYASERELIDMRNSVKKAGCRFALAGSIEKKHLPIVTQISPDIVAVRGAVCEGRRAGEISEQVLATFVASIREMGRWTSSETGSFSD